MSNASINVSDIGLQKEKSKYIFIDLLRGVAALLVVVFHQQLHSSLTEGSFPPYSQPWWLVYGFFDLGKYAVVIFFMVSGFLIPATLRAVNASVRDFAIQRFFRIYPAYWFSIGFFLVVCHFLNVDAIFSANVVMLNLTMLQQFFGQVNVIGVFWTLSIELIFYFLCVILFLYKRLSHQFWVILMLVPMGLAAAAVRYVTDREVPVAVFLALMVMFLGDTLRVFHQGGISRLQVNRNFLLTMISIVPIIFLAYQEHFFRYLITYYFSLGTFYFTFVNAKKIASSQLVCRISSFFGNISYSVYLTGAIIETVVYEIYYKQYGNKYVATTLLLTAVVAVSYLLFRFIEEPCIRLGRSLTRKHNSA